MSVKVDTVAGTLTIGDLTTPCVIGRSGACAADSKKEGDGCSPLGNWPVKAVLFRKGRSAPPKHLKLPWRWSLPSDGWSDGTADPAYNRPVRLPHRYSAETLHRDDMLYDIIVVLDHNMSPPVPVLGSAIFFHLWNEDKPAPDRTTEGCVAISRDAMMKVLPMLEPDMDMEIV